MIFKAQGQCPHCFKKGTQANLQEMMHHVDDISYVHGFFDYYVCKNPQCDVVYFSINSLFTQAQCNKEIGYKNASSEQSLICYCYNIKKESLNENTLGYIYTKMEEFPCACSSRNPYQTCCKGEILKLLRRVQ